MNGVALTIAGSDPSGGAGIQADLKTFQQFGIYGMSVITLITVQNTQSVERVEIFQTDLVEQQLCAVLSDIPPNAAKTGALGNANNIDIIANKLADTNFPLVIDPVMISKHGALLMEQDAIATLINKLLPRATLITPNVPEAELLANGRITDLNSMKEAAVAIAELGSRNVLIKGGHLSGSADDLLFADEKFIELKSERIQSRNTHGTGCVLSSAITALLAQGQSVEAAATTAKRFIEKAIRSAPGLGSGFGPVNLFVTLD